MTSRVPEPRTPPPSEPDPPAPIGPDTFPHRSAYGVGGESSYDEEESTALDRLSAWALFLLVAVLIATTQDLAFNVSYFLRQRDLLDVTVLSLAALMAVTALTRFQLSQVRWTRSSILLGLGIAGLGFEVFATDNSAEVFHVVEFFLLTLTAWRAWRLDIAGRLLFWSVFSTVALFGLVDEVVQEWNPRRYFDWMDVFLNARIALFSTLVLFASSRLHRPTNDETS